MVSLSYLLFVFLCLFLLYKLLQFLHKLVQLIYKVLRFILKKISPFSNKNVQVSSLNHSAPTGSHEYDVFLSFRGEDTRKTYKDDETLRRGESIGPSLFGAIRESRIAVVIFSKNYAESSWCLDELQYIMKCRDKRGLIVLPIFYGVDPSQVRRQKGDFGKGFAKQKVKNKAKAESWRKALVDASEISGWEPKNMANGNEAQVIKRVIDTILDRLPSLHSDVDEDLVGMETRLQDLESLIDMKSDGVRMVGIWGVGGSGKTTLATSFYMKIYHHYQGHCIVGNVREESRKYSIKKLQENILSSISKATVEVYSVEEGKLMIKKMLCRRKVLVIVDDVDSLDQLEALVGSHRWFGSGSRIIITSRDGHLLKTHKVDKVYHVTLLSDDDAIELFKRNAFNEKQLVKDYESLSSRAVSYANGLPLALKVLGSFLYDKDQKGWSSTLDRLKHIPEREIVEKLKISYDGLKLVEKELFLDIACFFRGLEIDYAMVILNVCDFHPEIGIEVLRQKSLITTEDGYFDMHELVEEMGHYIVRGENLKNPEKHSRVWKNDEIINMCFGDAILKENNNIGAIMFDCIFHGSDLLSRFCKIVSNMTKLRWLSFHISYEQDEIVEIFDGGPTFLSNELRYMYWKGYPTKSPFPDTFLPMNLVVLKLEDNFQDELWTDRKHLPHLKVLELKEMKNLISTPEFEGPQHLQKLILENCKELKQIHPSLGFLSLEYLRISWCPMLRMLPASVHMRNLKALEIKGFFLEDGEISSDISELSNLEELNLYGKYFSRLDFGLSQLTRLKILNLSCCYKLTELPELPSSLAILRVDSCSSLKTIGDSHKYCEWLCQVSFYEGCNENDGERLLQAMLEGKAITNGSILLLLPGLEIPRSFTPLLKGRSCRLELAENWHRDFSGFLMCAVMPAYFYWDAFKVRMNTNKMISVMDSQDDVGWVESDHDKHTFVWYISFSALTHTTWWDHTNKSLLFNIEEDDYQS